MRADDFLPEAVKTNNMDFDNFEIHASPFFARVRCPKDDGTMTEISNGWFSKCWYCDKCDSVYTLKLHKMRNINRENLTKALEEKAKKP